MCIRDSVRYYDEEDNREFTFLTNAKQLSALDVANLYKKRMSASVWQQVEHNEAVSYTHLVEQVTQVGFVSQ